MSRLEIALVLATLLVPTAASAQTTASEVAPDMSLADREAHARFESGRLAMESGRYEEALADFTRSYELSGRGIILFNIGLVHDRLRRDGEALDAFERYLEAVPDAPNREEVWARVLVLRRAMEQRQAAPQPSASMPMTETDTVAATASTPAPTASSGNGTLYLAGGITAGVLTLGAAIGAGAMWAAANDQYAQLDGACGAAGCSRAEIDGSGAPGLVTGTNVLLVSAIVAGVCTAAAFTLLALDVPSSSPGARLEIGPGTLRITF
jgi:tetratricopeptide (TPR) repeat protein